MPQGSQYPPSRGQPGIKNPNAVVENRNRGVQETMRVLLDSAGLPSSFWPCAAPYGTRMCNIRGRVPSGTGQETPYTKTHGEDCLAELMPFGCKVLFTPNEAQGFKLNKPDPRAVTGVFAGYSLKDEYRWDGHYFVWVLGDFVDKDLGIHANPTGYQHLTRHKVKHVELPPEGIVFPLRAKYERVKHTLDWDACKRGSVRRFRAGRA